MAPQWMPGARHSRAALLVIARWCSAAWLLLFASLGLQACSGAPASPSGPPDPADPNARVAASRYRAVTGGYVVRRPVEPTPWRKRNDTVAPQPKP